METTNTVGVCGSNVNKCKMIGGILVILFGLLFLAKALGWVSADTVNMVWPILVIVAGAGKLCRCKNCAGTCGCSK